MEIEVIFKLENDEKLHEYLMNHSSWYRKLNRDSEEIDKLIKEFKSFKREKNFTKVNEVVENIELMTNIMKFVE